MTTIKLANKEIKLSSIRGFSVTDYLKPQELYKPNRVIIGYVRIIYKNKKIITLEYQTKEKLDEDYSKLMESTKKLYDELSKKGKWIDEF